MLLIDSLPIKAFEVENADCFNGFSLKIDLKVSRNKGFLDLCQLGLDASQV